MSTCQSDRQLFDVSTSTVIIAKENHTRRESEFGSFLCLLCMNITHLIFFIDGKINQEFCKVNQYLQRVLLQVFLLIYF